jgi:hypothetical protein
MQILVDKRIETYGVEVNSPESRRNILDFGEDAFVIIPLIFTSRFAVFQKRSHSEAWVVRMGLYTSTFIATIEKSVFLRSVKVMKCLIWFNT